MYLKTTGKNISLFTLFVEFLRIGSLSFGGFMALISMIEERFVEKGSYLKNQTLLDGISIASVLPGPMAVNVVTYVGYRLRGMKGAMLSMFAVLLPTFIFIVVLSHFYFLYGDIPEVNKIFSGILPAVCAIILSVALTMALKNLKDKKQVLITLVAAAILLGIGGFWSTMAIMVLSAITGYFLYAKDEEAKAPGSEKGSDQVRWHDVFTANRVFFLSLAVIILFIVMLPLAVPATASGETGMLRKLAMTFGGVSVMLFGGGYVFIPMLQELIVGQLHWLTTKEFVDGIALGQITPGPIMISAAFIGYKMSGFTGALVASVAMFLPPGMVMVIVSHFIDNIKSSASVAAAFRGVRPAVIGMIFAAAWVIGHGLPPDWRTILIGIAVFVLSFKYKISVMYLIPLSGLAGWAVF